MSFFWGIYALMFSMPKIFGVTCCMLASFLGDRELFIALLTNVAAVATLGLLAPSRVFVRFYAIGSLI